MADQKESIETNEHIIKLFRDLIDGLDVSGNYGEKFEEDSVFKIGEIGFIEIKIEFTNGEKYSYKRGMESYPFFFRPYGSFGSGNRGWGVPKSNKQ